MKRSFLGSKKDSDDEYKHLVYVLRYSHQKLYRNLKKAKNDGNLADLRDVVKKIMKHVADNQIRCKDEHSCPEILAAYY